MVANALENNKSNHFPNLCIQWCVGQCITIHAETPMLIHALLALAVTSSSVPSSVVIIPAHVRSADSTAPSRRATFGIAIAPVPDAFRKLDYLVPGEGTVIAQVQPGSAADVGSLKVGDMILAIDGKRVDETSLFAAVREVSRGKAFTVEFLRDGRWRETSVTIER
jgi:S1-C subfamily serine protease